MYLYNLMFVLVASQRATWRAGQHRSRLVGRISKRDFLKHDVEAGRCYTESCKPERRRGGGITVFAELESTSRAEAPGVRDALASSCFHPSPMYTKCPPRDYAKAVSRSYFFLRMQVLARVGHALYLHPTRPFRSAFSAHPRRIG